MLTTDQIRTMLDAATDGPWMFNRLHGVQQAPSRAVQVAENSYEVVGVVPVENLQSDEDGELIAAAPDLAAEVLQLREGIKAVRDLHRKMPIYDIPVEECDHDIETYAIEIDGEWYCTLHISGYVCEHCNEMDEYSNTDTDYPCLTIRALDEADQ